MRDFCRLAEGLLGLRAIPEITLEIGHPRRLDLLGRNVIGTKLDASAKIGLHGALTVGSDENQAARGWRAAAGRRGGEGHAGGADIVAEHAAELIGANFADEADAAA